MNEEVNADLVAKLIGDERVTDSEHLVSRFPILRLSQEFIEDNTFDEGVGAVIRSMIVNKTFSDLPLCPCCDDGDPA